ncbi:MAG: hypothetical protein ACK2U9_07285, partial [Anaerolineae bacterium]
QYGFDGRQQLATAARELTLEDWQAYYRQVFLEQPHSLQVVAPGSWGELPPNRGPVRHSAEDIKEGHAVYTIE